MNTRFFITSLLFPPLLFFHCGSAREHNPYNGTSVDSLLGGRNNRAQQVLKGSDIHLSKAITFEKYTLENSYPYQDTFRIFQWDKIKELLATVENAQADRPDWGVLENRRNEHGRPPVAEDAERDAGGSLEDAYGVDQSQGIPLYDDPAATVPERYGTDGSLVAILRDSGDFTLIAPVYIGGSWWVPSKYLEPTGPFDYNKVVAVDRTNQNIAAIEKSDGEWLIRSMNPATTGLERPPYMRETPLGIFMVQEKKRKMMYTHDGSAEIAGYAPYASRFSNGGYIHGVPVNSVNGPEVEFSPTLGTTPRSHMCVRNATSHARFVYEWAPIHELLVLVLE